MTSPSVGDRVREIEKRQHTLLGWIKGLGIGAGLLVAVVGWWVHSELMPMIHQDQSDIAANSKDIAGLKGQLHELTGRQAKAEIQNDANLPPKALGAVLRDVKSALTMLRDQSIQVHPKVIDGLSQNLAAVPDKNNPVFWQTAALVISYRSSSLVGSLTNWTVFPACKGPADLDAHPGASAQAVTPEGKPIGPKLPIERIGEQDCYVQLDGKNASRWDCTRCLVKYSGGPLKIRDVHFKDCLFVLDFSETPASDGQRLSEALLASELKTVMIPGG